MSDDRLSIFLQRLRHLAGDQCSDSVLRTLFLEQLPDNVRTVLAISDREDLTKLAQQADRIMKLCKASVLAAESTSQPAPLTDKLRSSELIESLSTQLRGSRLDVRGRSNDRLSDILRYSKYRRRSSSRRHSNSSPGGECYYHSRFGSAAKKCQQPCSWQKNKQEN